MRVRLIMVGAVAAALFGGGSQTLAMNAGGTANPGMFFTPSGELYENARDASGWAPSSGSYFDTGLPGGTFGVGSIPFVFATDTPIGSLLASGYSTEETTPRLLTNGPTGANPQHYTLRKLEIADRIAPNVSLQLEYGVDPEDRFDAKGLGSLFLSPGTLNSPYTAFGSGDFYAGTTVGVGDGVSVNFGEVLLYPQAPAFSPPLLPFLSPGSDAAGFGQRAAQASHAGVDWQFARWGGIGVAAARSAERVGFLGAAPGGDLPLAKSASTSAVGVSGRLDFGKGWITTFTYNEGVTQLDMRPAVGVLTSDSLRGRGYGIAIAKHGLFGDDALGLALTRPLEFVSAGVDLGGPASADPFDGFLSENTHPILGGETPETDVQLGYVTTFMDGALALQANAGYQMNAAGQPGNSGVAVLSRAKINF